MTVDPDLEVFARWRGGDSKAGNELYLRHYKAIRRFFIMRFPGESEEDFMQETFARVVSNRDKFLGESTFKTYLFRIAKYVGDEHLRKRYRAGGHFERASSSLVDLTGRRPSSLLGEREHLGLLFQSIRSLSVEQQELLEAYFMQDLPAKEVAAALEIPVGTVRSRLRLARKRLQQIYSELSGQPHEVDEDQLREWILDLSEAIDRVPSVRD